MNAVVVVTPEQLLALVSEAVRTSIQERSPSEAPEVLTREQVANLLQVNPHHVPVLVRKHGLPSHRIGSQWRFRRTEVLEWLASQKGSK